MQDHGAAALCCGNCAWTGCDAYSKKLQVLRLKQARDTGSDLLDYLMPEMPDSPEMRHGRPHAGRCD